jgi:serine/threonine-protein kinase
MSESVPGGLSPGQLFLGRYQIIHCLKAGGMGAVYECIHLKTRKRRALKVMLPQILADAGMRERFELEARVTAEIESEHIVETFDAGVDDATGAPFLVMELLRGEDLGSIMTKRGPLPGSEIIVLLKQAALALDKMHAAGIVHRDLKPDNLYVTTRDDGTPRLKILDFGIAKVIASGAQGTQQTAMIGTPLYMSPEQIRGEGTVGPGSDVYAMGHIAFALLTGADYWADEQRASAATFTLLETVMAGLPEPATARAARRGVALPPAFDAWFVRATARLARDRFDSASMLIHELAGVLGAPAPRLATLFGMCPDLRVPASSFAGSTTMLARSATVAEQPGAPAPGVSAGNTGGASSNSIKLIGPISRSARMRVAVLGLGALGLAGLGLFGVSVWSDGSGPTVSPAATVGAPVAMPIAEASAPDPVPASTSSVTPEPTLDAGAAPATATHAHSAPLPKPAPAKPAPARPVAPASSCNPPYVMNSSGHRVMKSQCL